MTTSEGDLSYPGWRVAGASALGVFFASILVYGFAILLRPLTEEFGWSRATVSSAYSVMALASAAAAPLLGLLLDRYGPIRIVIPCLALCGVGIGSLSVLSGSHAQLFAVFAATGIAGIGTSALSYSRAVATWFDRRRGMALAIIISGGAVASMTHPPSIEALVRIAGWRQACLLLGALVLVVGLPVVAAFVRERGRQRGAALAEAEGVALPQALRSWILWVLILVVGTAAVATNAVLVHLPALLTDRGITSSVAAFAVSAMGAGSLGGRLLTGWLLDKFHGPIVSALLLVVAATGMFLLASPRSFELVLLAVTLIGAGLGGELNVTPFLLSRYFGLRSLSTLYGLSWTATGIAGAIGPFIMGRAFDVTGTYGAVVGQLALTTLAAGLLMLFLPRYDLRTRAQGVQAISEAADT